MCCPRLCGVCGREELVLSLECDAGICQTCLHTLADKEEEER